MAANLSKQEDNMSLTNQSSDKTYRAGIIGLTGIGQSPPRYNLWATRHPQPHSHAAAYAAHPAWK